MPPAFALSQDQTLRFINLSNTKHAPHHTGGQPPQHHPSLTNIRPNTQPDTKPKPSKTIHPYPGILHPKIRQDTHRQPKPIIQPSHIRPKPKRNPTHRPSNPSHHHMHYALTHTTHTQDAANISLPYNMQLSMNELRLTSAANPETSAHTQHTRDAQRSEA